MSRFLRRNPSIRTQRARKIESVRVNGATDSAMRNWWLRLSIPAIKDILPANRWNFDEYGIMEGQGTNGLVVESAHYTSNSMQDTLVYVPGLHLLSVPQHQEDLFHHFLYSRERVFNNSGFLLNRLN